jgi:alpha-tubulin suppressor-like RCC1 family protein
MRNRWQKMLRILVCMVFFLSAPGIGTSVVAAGGSSTNQVFSWGYNAEGQLGDGTNQDRFTPALLTGISDPSAISPSAISSGWFHNLVLRKDGTVTAWGGNWYGELGNGNFDHQNTPTDVVGLSGVKAVKAGSYHSLALKTDGSVWAWGNNNQGQLGDGTIASKSIAQPVSGLSDVVAIAAGWGHSLALKNDGTVWAWGLNDAGQLGIGPGGTAQEMAPQAFSRQSLSLDPHPFLDADGTEGTWGDLPVNQPARMLSAEDAPFYSPFPVEVTGLTGITAISAGYYHNLAIKSDGTIWAWGANWYGQLGDGTTINQAAPVQIPDLAGIRAVSAGYDHSLAIQYDGTVWAWGRNNTGQLGDGTTDEHPSPVQVVGVSGATAIAAGAYHSLAVGAGHVVWAWGWNGHGQLGDGTLTDRLSPVQITDVGAMSDIGAGFGHSLSFNGRPDWDINGDHITDVLDLALIGARWQESGIPGWISEDIYADGIIDVLDLASVGAHWLEEW